MHPGVIPFPYLKIFLQIQGDIAQENNLVVIKTINNTPKLLITQPYSGMIYAIKDLAIVKEDGSPFCIFLLPL